MFTSVTKRRGLTGLLFAALLIAGTATGFGTLAPAAQAATAAPVTVIGPGKPSEPGFVGYVLANGGQLGVARLANGTYVLCIDTGANHPWPTGTLTAAYKSNRIVGYLVGQYMPKALTDPYTAAALWWAVGLDEQLNSNPTDAGQHVTDLQTQDPTAYQKVAADHAAMLADARAHAAPAGGYQPNPPVITYTAGGGTVSGIGFKDRSGNWMAGYTVTVRLSGSAQFAKGTTTATVVTGTQPVGVSWTQTGTNPVTAKEVLTGAPADKYTLYTAPSPQQRTVAASAPTGRSATVTLPNGYVRILTTDAASGTPLTGATFTVWRDDNNDGVQQSSETPLTVTTDSTGYTGPITALSGERVCLIEKTPPTDYRRQTTTTCLTATGTATDAAVATVANDRIWQPTLTASTTSTIQVATQPHVAIAVADTGGHATTLTWTLLGPLTPNPAAAGGTCTGLTWTGAAKVATGTIAIPGDGTYAATAPPLTAPGCYTWAASTVGHSLIRAASAIAGQPAATFAAQAAPGIVNRINVRSAAPGTSLYDSLTVTDTHGQIVTGTWKLHGPVSPPYVNGRYTCAAVNWTDAPTTARGTFTTGQDGAVQVGTTTVNRPGCYTYTSSVTGSATVQAIPETRPGIAAESSRITAVPTIVARVGAERTTTGSTLYDVLTLSGTARQLVRGTWNLYGPVAPRIVGGSPTCAGVNWWKAPKLASDTFSASRDGRLSVGATNLTRAGCYTYTAGLWASATTAGFKTTPRGVPADTFRLG